MFTRVSIFLCSVLFSMTVMALDAVLPNENEWLRHQEREQSLRAEQEQVPDIRFPAPPVSIDLQFMPENELPCFTINHISMIGDSAKKFEFSLKSITTGTASVLGRCLGAEGMNIALMRVQNEIMTQGFVTTRVIIPPQDLKTGELQIKVIPGRVRAVSVKSKMPCCETLNMGLPIKAGDLLALRNIEQGLENLKRTPTNECNIEIVPAEIENIEIGESDLIIYHKQDFPLRLNLSIDDAGSKNIGKYQGGLTVFYDNPFALNDLFYINFNHDLNKGEKGSRGHTLHYSVPFEYWLLGFTTEQYQYYQSVAGSAASYIYSGNSHNSDMKLTRLLYRDAKRKTTGSMRFYLKDSNNFIDDTVIEVQRRRVAGWEAGVNHREFINVKILDLGLYYRHGTGAFGAIAAPEAFFDEGTARPIVITAHVMLKAPFAVGSQKLNYSGTWRAQWNKTELTPQDKFAIGGRYSVRGLDGDNMLSAERGWFIANDFGFVLGNTQQEAYLGVDYGMVRGPTADLLVGKQLAGTVLGLRGGFKGFFYDAFIGKPIYRPQGFEVSHWTAGFNIGWNSWGR